MKKRDKRGISLIVLVITVISTYDEANKIDRNPPENKMKIINENKVVGCKLTTFNYIVLNYYQSKYLKKIKANDIILMEGDNK